MTNTVTLTIGGIGAAFDGPHDRRAYTYDDQPHNGPAYNLGCAVAAAVHERSGDAIDAGLRLLLELQKRGFGVFEIKPTNPTPATRLAGTTEASTIGKEAAKIVINLRPKD